MNLFDFTYEENFNIPLANKIEQYHNHIKPELKPKQEAVINTMKSLGYPCTMHEVAENMQVSLNKISGRFSELVNLKQIKPIGRTDETGRRKTIYEVIC